MKNIITRVSALGLLLGVSAANAAIDVSSVTDAMSDGTTAAGTIGAAVLAFVAIVAVFKKVRGAI